MASSPFHSFVIVLVGQALAGARSAHAAPPWVERPLTLPSGDWAFDFGLGLAHDPASDTSAAGSNVEMSVGLTDRVELGVRTGLRFGDRPERGLEADNFGRLFDRQYFDGDNGAIANPELRLRGAVLRLDVFELGLEGRVIVPIEDNTAGVLFGVPVAFHLADFVRLDTGVFLPIVIGDADTRSRVSLTLPFDAWFQLTRRLWLGPMTGVVVSNIDRPNSHASLSLGFGLGYQITHYLDFKTMLLFPEVTDDSFFGIGAGVEVRVE